MPGSSEDRLDEIRSKLEEIDNKLERIKSDTHNLNRIASISNSEVIVRELERIVGESKIRAAILHFTEIDRLISSGELAEAVGIFHQHLRRSVRPFLNRGYINEIRRGRRRYFQRSELVDLVGFEATEKFSSLLESWRKERDEEKDAD